MDKSLIAFLNPERKENLKLAINRDTEGNPLVWEFKDLPAKESMEIARRYANNTGEVLQAQVAHACVRPPLKDQEFLEALSNRVGRTILDPTEALYALLQGSELTTLMAAYLEYFQGDSFVKMIENAKN